MVRQSIIRILRTFFGSWFSNPYALCLFFSPNSPHIVYRSPHSYYPMNNVQLWSWLVAQLAEKFCKAYGPFSAAQLFLLVPIHLSKYRFSSCSLSLWGYKICFSKGSCDSLSSMKFYRNWICCYFPLLSESYPPRSTIPRNVPKFFNCLSIKLILHC